MARVYTNQPTLDVDFIQPQSMSFDVVANAVDGGRNLAGQSISSEITGGGFVTAAYRDCYGQEREAHEYFNWLSARLTGSFRFINVPLKTDWMGPFPMVDRSPFFRVTGIPYSDGALFSDGSGHSQTPVFGAVTASATGGAGVISIRVYGAYRPLRWSDWFSIYHETKGWRAYRYWDVASMSSEGSEEVSGATLTYRDYTLAIQPTLREAITAGQRVEFSRPKFVAKLAPGEAIPWDVKSFWVAQPTLSFVEAF